MAATLSRVILDTEGNVQMIIHPDDDMQLGNPAFSAQGSVLVDLARSEYSKQASQRDLLALVASLLAKVHPAEAQKVTEKIGKIDDEVAAAAALLAANNEKSAAIPNVDFPL